MSIDSRTIYLSDTSAADNDKSWTVPTNRIWSLKAARCVLTSSDTVGNRLIQLTVDPNLTTPAADTLPYVDIRAGVAQAASLTYYYNFFHGASRITTIADTDWASIQLPDADLRPGSVIRIFDSANVDASSDQLDVKLVIEARGGVT